MTARPADPARSRIVLIGTPVYADPAIEDVPAVANNIFDLASVFLDPELGGFSPANCTIAAPAATMADIGDLLFSAAREAEDLLLVYYSGHGFTGGKRHELFLSLSGSRVDRPAFTALPFDAVRDAILHSPARNRVLILDSCYSGRAIGDPLGGIDEQVMEQIEVAGTFTLTSAPANRAALILPGERHTAFTGRLLDLLRSGHPGAGDVLTLGEIYRLLRARLRSEGLPLPQQRGTNTADLLGLVLNCGAGPPAEHPGTRAWQQQRDTEAAHHHDSAPRPAAVHQEPPAEASNGTGHDTKTPREAGPAGGKGKKRKGTGSSRAAADALGGWNIFSTLFDDDIHRVGGAREAFDQRWQDGTRVRAPGPRSQPAFGDDVDDDGAAWSRRRGSTTLDEPYTLLDRLSLALMGLRFITGDRPVSGVPLVLAAGPVLWAIGWLFGAHGVHLLGSGAGIGNRVAFFVSLVPVVLAFGELSRRVARTMRGIFRPAVQTTLLVPLVLFAAVSAALHAIAPGIMAHALGLDHGAGIIRDWMIWRL